MNMREYHREYYYKRRQKLLDYLGARCAECGATEQLHFDHIDRTTKNFDIRDNLTLNDEVKAELDKCQLLCKEHHFSKTSKEQSGFTHGTMYGWMKKKCTCNSCIDAKQIWYAERNVKRRK